MTTLAGTPFQEFITVLTFLVAHQNRHFDSASRPFANFHKQLTGHHNVDWFLPLYQWLLNFQNENLLLDNITSISPAATSISQRHMIIYSAGCLYPKIFPHPKSRLQHHNPLYENHLVSLQVFHTWSTLVPFQFFLSFCHVPDPSWQDSLYTKMEVVAHLPCIRKWVASLILDKRLNLQTSPLIVDNPLVDILDSNHSKDEPVMCGRMFSFPHTWHWQNLVFPQYSVLNADNCLVHDSIWPYIHCDTCWPSNCTDLWQSLLVI